MAFPQILLIEDHTLFKIGLTTSLQILGDVDIVETSNIEQALTYEISPNVILMDIQLGGMSGLDGIATIREKWPLASIIILSAHDSHANQQLALAAGAFAFLSKADSLDTILSTITRAIQISNGASPFEHAQKENQSVQLSERQMEVLRLLAKGMSNKMIGSMLGVSENTIRWHVRILLTSLNVSTRAEATFAAVKLGLIR